MFAVVLVGGFGTRLRPLTHDVPKPMLPVVHRPMIVRLVDRLAAGGVTEVVLALGFKPEPFAGAFPEGRHGDVLVHYAVEPEPLDTGGAIAFAAREAGVDGTFVVANGDVITDLDVAHLVGEHRRLGVDGTVHLTSVDDPSAFGVVELDDRGVVSRFVEKPVPGETTSSLVNAGTYVFEPTVLDLIEPLERVSIERDTFPQLVEAGRLAGVATSDYWIDAGRTELFLQVNLDLISGDSPPEAVHASARVDDEAIVIQSVVGDGAVIESAAAVTDSVLLPGAFVGRGATVESSIIAGRVEPGAFVHDSVIGASYTVPTDASVVGDRLPSHE